MTGIGETAKDFTLNDHFGRAVSLGASRGKCNFLLLFYPLDWTPT